jgi:hypothetical protein
LAPALPMLDSGLLLLAPAGQWRRFRPAVNTGGSGSAYDSAGPQRQASAPGHQQQQEGGSPEPHTGTAPDGTPGAPAPGALSGSSALPGPDTPRAADSIGRPWAANGAAAAEGASEGSGSLVGTTAGGSGSLESGVDSEEDDRGYSLRAAMAPVFELASAVAAAAAAAWRRWYLRLPLQVGCMIAAFGALLGLLLAPALERLVLPAATARAQEVLQREVRGT